MPDPNSNDAILAAATQLAGTSINAWSAANTNRKERQWQEMMYAKQRADAMSDWTKQNEYNSPAAQMARLKAAGLNPNLVYGAGATAMASSQPRASTPGSWHPTAPQVFPEQAVAAYYNTKIQEANIRNLDTKNTVLLADAAMKAGQLDKLRVDTQKGKTQIASIEQQTGQRTQLLPILMEQIKANIAKMGATTGVLQSDKLLKDAEKLRTEMETTKGEAERKVILARNEREAAMNSQNIRESVQRILNLRQEEAHNETDQIRIRQLTKLAEADTKIKEAEAEMYRRGIRPGDPWFWRKTQELLNELDKRLKRVGPSRTEVPREGGGQEHSW